MTRNKKIHRQYLHSKLSGIDFYRTSVISRFNLSVNIRVKSLLLAVKFHYFMRKRGGGTRVIFRLNFVSFNTNGFTCEKASAIALITKNLK